MCSHHGVLLHASRWRRRLHFEGKALHILCVMFHSLADYNLNESRHVCIQISPPEGWVFEPPEYEIQVDGVSDHCSKGIDINFDFKGFSVLGNVVTEGFKSQGPSGVTVTLQSPQILKIKFETLTKEGGTFAFEKIPPGHYVLKASHPTLSFGKASYAFEVTNKNMEIDNQVRQ